MKRQKKLRSAIEKELRHIRKELDAGTLDRKKLESGLKKLEKYVINIPWFKADVDKD